MPAYLIEFEVDGTDFNGTQVQAFGRTVQGAIGEALAVLDPTATVRAGSRLDQGVSARAYPAVCRMERAWTPAILGLALNQKLPSDLVAVRCAPVADDFNPQRVACVKTYSYTILQRPVRPVLWPRCWWLRDLPQVEVLPDLAALIPGRRDLSGFASLRHDETDTQDPVREYLSATWTSDRLRDGLVHRFEIAGKGFLYKQIRGLVGAMIDVAQAKHSREDFLIARDGGWGAPRLGNVAPAEGLCLESVVYEAELGFAEVSVANR